MTVENIHKITTADGGVGRFGENGLGTKLSVRELLKGMGIQPAKRIANKRAFMGLLAPHEMHDDEVTLKFESEAAMNDEHDKVIAKVSEWLEPPAEKIPSTIRIEGIDQDQQFTETSPAHPQGLSML